MAMNRHQEHAAGPTLVTILLVAVTIGLICAVLALSTAASANRGDSARWVFFLRMMYVALVLLVVAVVLLAKRGIRWLIRTTKPHQRSEPTSDISAWKEAGRRFTLPPEDQDDETDRGDE